MSIPTATRALVLALVLIGAGPVLAQAPEGLAPHDARMLAAEAATGGAPALAREIALELLAADPDDRAALGVLAVAAPQLGRPREGREAAERAFRLATTPVQRFEAARLAAAAAAVEGRPLLAEFWLRRALLAAPDREARAVALADAGALRDASPWRVDVELGFSPSSNVNGGAESPFNIVDGLPFVGLISVDGRALSGWAATADLEVARRLSENARQRTELSFRLGGRAVFLSEEARDLIERETREEDPDLTGRSFSSTYAEVGLAQDRLVGNTLLRLEAGLGQDWGGDWAPFDPFDPLAEENAGASNLEPTEQRLSLSGSLGRPLAEEQYLRLGFSGEQRWRLDGGADEMQLGASAAWILPGIGEGDRLTLGLSRGETLSDNGNAAASSWGLRASYDLGRAVGPARLGASLGVAWTEFPDYAVLLPVPGGREDRRLSGRLEASFEDWSVAGFVPVVSLEAARNESNVSRFDTETLGLGITLRSSF